LRKRAGLAVVWEAIIIDKAKRRNWWAAGGRFSPTDKKKVGLSGDRIKGEKRPSVALTRRGQLGELGQFDTGESNG